MTQVLNLKTPSKRKADRHAPSTAQLNARVPCKLRDAFQAVCAAHSLIPAEALRTLLQSFVDNAATLEVHHG